MKYIIANWKAHKNIKEVEKWIDTFLKHISSSISEKIEIVLCPPFPFLTYLKEKLKSYPFIKLGAQDVSLYNEGAYTGEVTASNLKGLAEYVLIGHSERREYFQENKTVLFKKTRNAAQSGVQSIFCIRDSHDRIPQETTMVAYEPVYAISTSGIGKNEPLEKVVKTKQSLHLPSHTPFIYGGSVTDQNVGEYLTSREIDGVLVGGASLKPELFLALIETSIKG